MKRSDLHPDLIASLVRLPSPFDSHYGVVPPAPPDHPILVDAGEQMKASQALGEAKRLQQEMVDQYRITRVLLRKEALSSSAIEGTNSTLDAILETEEADIGAKPDKSATNQVRDYAVALERFLPEAAQYLRGIFDRKLLSDLHCAIMASDPDYQDVPGRYRNRVVWIGGGQDIAYSIFNPPPPELIPGLMEGVLEYMRAEGMESFHQSLITRMAVSHVHFEAVHPFRDGNGRAGRLLLPLMMAAEGEPALYLSPFIEANRPRYYDALKAGQQRLDYRPAISLMCRAITETVAEISRTQDALDRLIQIWMARRKWRRNSAAEKLLYVLFDRPVITVARAAATISVTFPAANQAISQLVDAGILTEITGHARNRMFRVKEVLSILNRPFGEEPVLPEE